MYASGVYAPLEGQGMGTLKFPNVRGQAVGPQVFSRSRSVPLSFSGPARQRRLGRLGTSLPLSYILNVRLEGAYRRLDAIFKRCINLKAVYFLMNQVALKDDIDALCNSFHCINPRKFVSLHS